MSETTIDTMSPTRAKKRPVRRYLFVGVATLAILAATGISNRRQSDAALAQWTNARAVANVDLVSPHDATEVQNLTLPADIEAFNVAHIHARVSGYVKAWYSDIGAKVKAGQVIARIDTPDLDQSYEQAKSELEKTQADLALANVTAARWNALRSSAIVSQQAADEKQSAAVAGKAEVATAEANLNRLKAMEGFKDIVAPFDGVVTNRRVDIGALVSSTSSATWNDPSLFDVSAVDQVRVYVRVPQVYAAQIHKGMPINVTLPQYAGRTFSGTVDTTSNAIAQTSRTLLVEALFDNKGGLLSPGSYARASFALPLDPNKLAIPVSALIFRNTSPEVAVVDGDEVKLKKVSILADTGTTIELADGLKASDKIVLHPSDVIASGDQVHVVAINGTPVDHRLASAPSRSSTAEE